MDGWMDESLEIECMIEQLFKNWNFQLGFSL